MSVCVCCVCAAACLLPAATEKAGGRQPIRMAVCAQLVIPATTRTCDCSVETAVFAADMAIDGAHGFHVCLYAVRFRCDVEVFVVFFPQ